jgi:hypothetical protein
MKIIFRFCLLVIFSLAATGVVYSCTCVQREHKDEIEKTDVIFSGKVIEITEDTGYIPSKREGVSPDLRKRAKRDKRFLVRFKIEDGFKEAVSGGEITLVQYKFEKPPPCGDKMFFVKGRKYLVYASWLSDGELSGNVSTCSRTRFLNKESSDYRELLQLDLKSKNKGFS